MPYKRNVPTDIFPDDIKNLIPVKAAVELKFEPAKVACVQPRLPTLATPVENTVFRKVVLDGFGMYITKLAPFSGPLPALVKSLATRYEVVLPFAAPV